MTSSDHRLEARRSAQLRTKKSPVIKARSKKNSQKFGQQLVQARQTSELKHKNLIKARQEGQEADQLLSSERAKDLDKQCRRSQGARVINTLTEAYEKIRKTKYKKNKSSKKSKKLKAAAMQAAIESISKIASQSSKTSSAAPQRVPRELLELLAKEVWVGVNELGQTEMQIDLKEGVLQGVTLMVTAEDGRVVCKFAGGDNNARRLLEASEGELSRALEKKSLRLEKLTVV